MSDQKKRAHILATFNDDGTGESYAKGDTPLLDAGVYANYEAAGLVGPLPATTKAAAKPKAVAKAAKPKAKPAARKPKPAPTPTPTPAPVITPEPDATAPDGETDA